MKNKQTISFYTLGCRLNQSETAVIRNSFVHDGYTVVDITEPADYTVINTCTVTENGDADTRRLVNKINRVNPETRIALIGCQAQVQKEKLINLPNVFWVIGNEHKIHLKEILYKLKDIKTPRVIAPAMSRESFTMPVAGIDPQHTRANIKIQDGCNFFCSFCEIPYARGRARSRVFEDIKLEANALVAAGHKELVVTGINVGTYAYKQYRIMDVITALEDIEGLKRIRISSIEPTTIPAGIIKKMASRSKLCRYLHIPLQSGDNAVLKMMKRKYTTEKFTRFIQRVHDTVPAICIGTDVIAGFPAETDTSFQKTLNLLKKLPIHYLHVFSYSRRKLAKSRRLFGAIPSGTIHARSQILRELSQRKQRQFIQSLTGTVQRVLFEQQKEGHWSGLTDNYVRVNAQTHKNLSNQILPVTITSVNGQQARGVLKDDK